MGIEKLLDWGQLSCVRLLSAVVLQHAVVRLTLIGFGPALLSKQCCCVLSVSTMITIVVGGRETTDISTSHFFLKASD